MAIFKVSTQQQLQSAVNSARSGDTIALAKGTYDGFTMGKTAFAQKLTITSADPNNPATVNEFMLRGVKNVEFKNLTLDYNPAKSGGNPFWIEGSSNITLTSVDIEGQIKGNYGDGVGLRIKNSNGVTLQNSEISDFRNGFYASHSADVKILNNDFRGMSNDGMLFGGMTRVLIQGNDLRDMRSNPNAKHKDGIQFLTSSTEPGSKDIVIRDNVIVNKEVTHGIFFTNTQYTSGKAGVYHSDILIEGNVLQTNQVHGISINHGNGITIRDNVVEQIKGGSNTPLINVSKYSVDVRILNNDVASVQSPQNSSWTVAGNDAGKQRLHWYGDPGAPKVLAGKSDGNFSVAGAAGAATATKATADAGTADKADAGAATTVSGSKSGASETFRVGGHRLDDGATLRLADVDFDGGDKIVFSKLDAGTFGAKKGGNPIDIWDAGGSAKIDDVMDLRELVAFSKGLSATTSGDQLILEVDQRGATADIVLDGLGAEYRAADQPELF